MLYYFKTNHKTVINFEGGKSINIGNSNNKRTNKMNY